MTPPTALTEHDPRERILRAAVELLSAAGRDAVSTRAVSAAAGVQPPTIYRHFGDMRRLVDAAASRGMADYLQEKRSRPHEDDPVDDLRAGWDLHVNFGVTRPHIYTVLYGDPRPGEEPRGVAEGNAILRGLLQRIAVAGRLRVEVDHAAEMVHSGCRGVALTLIATPPAERDLQLSTAVREALLAAVTTDSPDRDDGKGLVPRAIALKAAIEASPPSALSSAEATMFLEWLNRLLQGD
ncbi:TetR/AcrR family transcriptional regulator [Mycolicibacterium sp. S2-37]|uniref:TetR/AcrR family transcriptional regulator n=1 Tax=Mycolicibacterium sp. S2-37 TaxID=2810297 RepID=UPI001A947A86|nr:TetR/AcrR family transcriptional regulator [Mycolicibacterium sp. S2-37]MBO0679486.1 TetR/AcrR family transcriptional regulator [Mycolicibacterium sp. S2-37]